MNSIDNFLEDGKLKSFPAKRKMKLYALLWLAERIDLSVPKTEKEINEAINRLTLFKDPATLRRELFDYGLIDRTSDCTSYYAPAVKPTWPDELD